jgi:hypothetical protein
VNLARYLAFATLCLIGPGLGALRLLRADPQLALVLPLGSALAAGAYWVSLTTSLPWLFPAILAPFVAAAFFVRVEPADVRRQIAPALLPFGACVALLATTQYPGNRVDRSGQFLLDPLVPFDTSFHVGLARELVHAYPPQVPGVSGFPLGYHLGPDLLRAAALRHFGVDPFDSIARFDVTLGAMGLLLALVAAARACGLSPAAVRLAPWALLATDFSFAFANLPEAHWWADLLRGNLLLSLALANPVIPGLTLTLGALLALSAFLSGGRTRPGLLVAAALLAGAVPHFKVFLGPHLLLGLGAILLASPRRLVRPIALVAVPCLASTALLALGQGGRTVEITLAPLDLARVTRDVLGLPSLGGVRFLAWAVLWIAASLGLRLLGLRRAIAAAFCGPEIGRALAAMGLAAWPLALLFRVSAPEVLAGQAPVNDAGYLLEQGGVLLWIFAAAAISGVSIRSARTPFVLALAAALAFPSTVQFVVAKRSIPLEAIPAPMLRAMAELEAASRPGDVVIQRPGARYPPLPVVLIGRRVAYERFTPYLTQFVPREALERRHEAVHRFFRTKDAREARAIARSLGARFVCLYGPDRVRFPRDALLEPLYDQPGASVFRIRATAGAQPEAGGPPPP